MTDLFLTWIPESSCYGIIDQSCDPGKRLAALFPGYSYVEAQSEARAYALLYGRPVVFICDCEPSAGLSLTPQ